MTNTSPAEQLARMEDARVGRVVPNWRYQLDFFLIVAAFGVGRVLDDVIGANLLVTFGILFAAAIAHSLILGPYRRRTLS